MLLSISDHALKTPNLSKLSHPESEWELMLQSESLKDTRTFFFGFIAQNDLLTTWHLNAVARAAEYHLSIWWERRLEQIL